MKWVKVFDLLDWNANDEKVLEKKSEITSFKGVAEKVNDYWPIQVWKRWFLCHSSVFHIWPFWRSTLSFSMGCHIIKSCDEILLIVAQRLVHSLLVLYWSALLHVYFGLLLWCILRMHMQLCLNCGHPSRFMNLNLQYSAMFRINS